HWLLGAEFTATSMIGWIALAGIIVRNSILLVDFAIIQVEMGIPLQEAVILSCKTRTRPIVITAFALVAGAGVIITDPIFQGMAISLLFGVLISTVLTLIVIPLGCISVGIEALCSSGGYTYTENIEVKEPEPSFPPMPLWMRIYSTGIGFVFTIIGLVQKVVGAVQMVFYIIRAVFILAFSMIGGLWGKLVPEKTPPPPKKPATPPPPKETSSKPAAVESKLIEKPVSTTPVPKPVTEITPPSATPEVVTPTVKEEIVAEKPIESKVEIKPKEVEKPTVPAEKPVTSRGSRKATSSRRGLQLKSDLVGHYEKPRNE
ncbi:MAG: efflux RND transporter permease subunit, partial [Proteobacteria bacterium]|nr:efflux RND transporter permease subunit [Pseudomonadota bacterium]